MIKIQNNSKEISEKENISYIIRFLSKKEGAIDLLANFCFIFGKKHTSLNDQKKICYRKKLLDFFKVYKGIYDYSDKEIQKFIDHWIGMTNEDMGELLENAMVLLGPVHLRDIDSWSYKRESRVFNISNYKNNVDIIFYDKSFQKILKCNKKILISKDSEFIECKRDISNYIPRDIDKKIEKNNTRNKLMFMDKISKKYKESFVYFVTFIPSTNAYEQYLKEHGMCNIKVYSWYDLYCMKVLE